MFAFLTEGKWTLQHKTQVLALDTTVCPRFPPHLTPIQLDCYWWLGQGKGDLVGSFTRNYPCLGLQHHRLPSQARSGTQVLECHATNPSGPASQLTVCLR